jgi:flavin-dependent dehydrogenase
MRKDVVVVGAGPAGLYTALHIDTRKVTILEEHGEVGSPKHCSGIVGSLVAREISKLHPKIVDAYYEKTLFITPTGKIELNFKKPFAFHVNRPLLEETLATKVESRGHEIIYRAKATPVNKSSVKAKSTVIDFTTLIVADGANSLFRRFLVGDTLRYLHGLQLIVEAKNIEEKTLTIIYSNINPEFFAWIIPLNDEEAQVGYASSKPMEKVLYKLIEENTDLKLVGVKERYGGLIPVHHPLKNPVLHGKIVFHGDSVPLIKPYTGGGLYYIFRLSPILGEYVDRDDLIPYSYIYMRTYYVKNSLERLLVNFFKKMRYYLPVQLISKLNKLSFLSLNDFDEHYKILFKALVFTPFSPLLLFS